MHAVKMAAHGADDRNRVVAIGKRPLQRQVQTRWIATGRRIGDVVQRHGRGVANHSLGFLDTDRALFAALVEQQLLEHL